MRRLQKSLIGFTLSFALVAQPALANYRAAQAYFQRRDFISSAGAFFQAYGYPKERGEREKAEWGLAQSLQLLGFYYSASKYYSVIVRRGPGANNPFFRQAMEELGKINTSMSLGQAHVVQLFKTKIDPSAVPGAARGFYFYYLGIEAFNRRKFEQAASYFSKVPDDSSYGLKAAFHLGVISNMRGTHSRAISYFERVIQGARGSSETSAWLREQAHLNIARVHYETKRYRSAIGYYNMIPRDSDNWLQALFEAAWAFFMMQKHNSTLGTIHTIHAPFFENRFFPETYILQAITFLRLCRYQQVKASLGKFKNRYKPVFDDVRKILDRYDRDSSGFFKLIYNYRIGALNDHKKAWAILDALSRTDAYKEAGSTIRFSDNELARLSRYSARWGSSGLQEELSSFLRNKKSAAVKDAGQRLFEKATGYYAYLKELSDQTNLINAEMVLGRVDAMRAKLKVPTADKRANFIGGLAPLEVGQEVEYWPFEGEYWEDELGGYIYNIESLCGKDGRKKANDKDGDGRKD